MVLQLRPIAIIVRLVEITLLWSVECLVGELLNTLLRISVELNVSQRVELNNVSSSELAHQFSLGAVHNTDEDVLINHKMNDWTVSYQVIVLEAPIACYIELRIIFLKE
jgi:hypothetical protein